MLLRMRKSLTLGVRLKWDRVTIVTRLGTSVIGSERRKGHIVNDILDAAAAFHREHGVAPETVHLTYRDEMECCNIGPEFLGQDLAAKVAMHGFRQMVEECGGRKESVSRVCTPKKYDYSDHTPFPRRESPKYFLGLEVVWNASEFKVDGPREPELTVRNFMSRVKFMISKAKEKGINPTKLHLTRQAEDILAALCEYPQEHGSQFGHKYVSYVIPDEVLGLKVVRAFVSDRFRVE